MEWKNARVPACWATDADPAATPVAFGSALVTSANQADTKIFITAAQCKSLVLFQHSWLSATPRQATASTIRHEGYRITPECDSRAQVAIMLTQDAAAFCVQVGSKPAISPTFATLQALSFTNGLNSSVKEPP